MVKAIPIKAMTFAEVLKKQEKYVQDNAAIAFDKTRAILKKMEGTGLVQIRV